MRLIISELTRLTRPRRRRGCRAGCRGKHQRPAARANEVVEIDEWILDRRALPRAPVSTPRRTSIFTPRYAHHVFVPRICPRPLPFFILSPERSCCRVSGRGASAMTKPSIYYFRGFTGDDQT